MSKCIAMVWFAVDREDQDKAPKMSLIETDYPDFAAFSAAIERDEYIHGATLRTRRVAAQHFEIVGRRRTTFRGGAVQRCEETDFRYDEAEAV